MSRLFKKLKHIGEGWSYYFSKNSDVEESAKKKAMVCVNCDSAVMSVWDEVLPDTTLKEVKGMKCDECDCPLSTLLRSNKPCELGKF